MKELPLTKGKVALIDDEDFEFLSQWKWSFDDQYAIRGEYLGKIDGKHKYKKLYMHRILNKTPKGMETDHINRNKLDNQKVNLKSATRSQNSSNHPAHKNNICGVVGVNWYKQIGKYCARIVRNGEKTHLGYFSDINDAIKARREAEDRYAGL